MALGIIIIAIITLTIAYQKGLLPFGLVSSGKYLIVVPDEFSSDQTLQAYANARGASYAVEVVTMSQILSAETYNNSQNYLMISSVTSIQGLATVDILWYDGISFHVYATNYGGFNQVETSVTPQKAILWVWAVNGAHDVGFTYDGGQSITVPIDNYYVNFGLHYILSNGSVYMYAGSEMAVHDYAVQRQAGYLLLMGDLTKIPSFQMMAVGYACLSFQTGVTDRPYSYSNLNAVTNAPDINVGRIPVQSVQEMDAYLTKDLAYVPHAGNRAFLTMGLAIDPNYPTFYNSFVSEMTQAINQAYPSEIVDSLYNCQYDEMVTRLNSGYDNVVIFAHGGYPSVDGLDINFLSQIAISSPSIIFGLGCESSDFSRIGRASTARCLGEAFINDPDSKLLAYLGGTVQMYSDESAIRAYYSGIRTFNTLGASFSYGLSQEVIPQQRFAWELFGDPTLIVSDASPPVQVLQGVWSINNIPVTSPSETLYFNTTQLAFKFVKTLGTVDSSINCYVIENGVTLATLAYQGSSTWIGTVNFAGGTHVLTLRATDGTHTVTMTLTSH